MGQTSSGELWIGQGSVPFQGDQGHQALQQLTAASNWQLVSNQRALSVMTSV